MQRRNRNRRGRSNRQAALPYTTFTDTVRVQFSAGAPSGFFTFNITDIVPSLAIDSAVSRIVIVEHVMLEVLPNEVNDQLTVQMRTTLANAASHPFKVCSITRPTRFHLDFVKLSKVAPSVLFPIQILNTSSEIFRVQVYSDAQDIGLVGRMTTRVRVLPQRSLLNPVPNFFSTSLTSADDTNQQKQFPTSPMGESPPPPADATGEAGHGGPNDLGNWLGHAH